MELGLDPVNRVAITLGPLAAVTELGEPLERRLVVVEGEAADEDLGCVVLVFLNQRGGGGHRDGESAEGEGAGHGDRRYSGEG